MKVPASVGTATTGKVDLQVYFYAEDGLATIDLATTGNGSTQLTKNFPNLDKSITPGTGPDFNGQITEVDKAKNYYSAHLSGDVSAGVNLFTATFKNAKGDIILEHKETLYVDGGNLSEKIIYIPQGSYNRPPANPEGLPFGK